MNTFRKCLAVAAVVAVTIYVATQSLVAAIGFLAAVILAVQVETETRAVKRATRAEHRENVPERVRETADTRK